ncbi:hypothetical protein N7492_004905 [Penicillium capsulatum]|uniref:Prenylated rab acceptor 1 n=1 Tax=Penicillium capsulatum TaxID=69766 RepID=A0A9W9ICF4_9EURO|nr:hypothetical protein N7492_004905 [Penicillium capsulatum]KAJ6135987.1 hypothetical protein N7512_001147 [Penicillium capsulatum]
MGRHTRGRGQWDEVDRIEEVESDEEDAYGRELVRTSRYMRPLEYGARGPRRRSEYEDLTDENESVVDGGDYDLYEHGDSTVAYAVQLAMRDKEDQLVDKALDRIRRAQMLGKKNVRLSRRELDALERKRQQTGSSSGLRRNKPAASASNSRPSSRRGPEQPGAYPAFAPDGDWGRGTGAAHGRPSSSSSSHRPRTPTMQSLRPQQSNSPLRPTYPPFTDRLPPNGRPQSMHQHPMYGRPLPDDPQWTPPFYNPVPMNPYLPEQPPYQPQLPSDLRVGPQSRMSYPAGLPPSQTQPRQSLDGRTSTGPSPPRGNRPESSDPESESTSDEEETDSSDEDGEGVPLAQVLDRPPAGLQRRNVSGGNRGGRPRKSR